MLHLATKWNGTGLSMYIDDGNLFACAKDFTERTTLRQAYRDCISRAFITTPTEPLH
jgi:hypothetical protein